MIIIQATYISQPELMSFLGYFVFVDFLAVCGAQFLPQDKFGNGG